MTHTLLKAGLASLVLASPFALAQYNNSSSDEGSVMICLGGFIQSEDISYTNKATVDADNTAALNHMALTIGEGQDKFNLNFGFYLSASTALNESVGLTGFLDVAVGANEGKYPDLDGAQTIGSVEHGVSFAPGVTIDYGCFGVGARFLVASHEFKSDGNAEKIDEKAIQVGFKTSTNVDLEGDMSGLRFEFAYFTTLHGKSDDAKTKIMRGANFINENTVTDTFYNNVDVQFKACIEVASI